MVDRHHTGFLPRLAMTAVSEEELVGVAHVHCARVHNLPR